jgi:hypothetical protein
MNYFLESEEDEEVDGKINYKKIKFTLGEKSGSKLDAEKTEEK